MRVIINDANILIDLVQLDLMKEFIQLELDLKTSDFVYEELNDEQKKVVAAFVKSGDIKIIVTDDDDDLNSIVSILTSSSGLSFEDCSVLHYASKLNGILLSGDGKLRKQALANGITVRGILFIFDQLLLNNLITFESAINKIKVLYDINPRLPGHSKDERISAWILNQHVT